MCKMSRELYSVCKINGELYSVCVKCTDRDQTPYIDVTVCVE